MPDNVNLNIGMVSMTTRKYWYRSPELFDSMSVMTTLGVIGMLMGMTMLLVLVELICCCCCFYCCC